MRILERLLKSIKIISPFFVSNEVSLFFLRIGDITTDGTIADEDFLNLLNLTFFILWLDSLKTKGPIS